jgi:hypothetical protein
MHARQMCTTLQNFELPPQLWFSPLSPPPLGRLIVLPGRLVTLPVRLCPVHLSPGRLDMP